MVTKGEKNNSNVILEESEKIKIDLVNFFHGKNEWWMWMFCDVAYFMSY